MPSSSSFMTSFSLSVSLNKLSRSSLTLCSHKKMIKLSQYLRLIPTMQTGLKLSILGETNRRAEYKYKNFNDKIEGWFAQLHAHWTTSWNSRFHTSSTFQELSFTCSWAETFVNCWEMSFFSSWWLLKSWISYNIYHRKQQSVHWVLLLWAVLLKIYDVQALQVKSYLVKVNKTSVNDIMLKKRRLRSRAAKVNSC